MKVRLWGASVDLAETPQGKEASDEAPGEHTRAHQRERIQWRMQINRQAAGNLHSVAPWKPSGGDGW